MDIKRKILGWFFVVSDWDPVFFLEGLIRIQSILIRIRNRILMQTNDTRICWRDVSQVLYTLMFAHFTMRTYGLVKHEFRFVEGIWLHRKSSQNRFFFVSSLSRSGSGSTPLLSQGSIYRVHSGFYGYPGQAVIGHPIQSWQRTVGSEPAFEQSRDS